MTLDTRRELRPPTPRFDPLGSRVYGVSFNSQVYEYSWE